MKPCSLRNEGERDGYGPNVVYTFGALLHGRELVIPCAMSDYATSFATVPLDNLLAAIDRRRSAGAARLQDQAKRRRCQHPGQCARNGQRGHAPGF